MFARRDRGVNTPEMARPPRSHRLSPDDLARIEAAAGAAVDLKIGLYSPNGPVRRVNREMILMVGGGRALLMQIAHPLVAAGVAAHSNFEKEPLARLWRTLELTLAMVFGDASTAMAALHTIERRHGSVRGTLGEALGPYAETADYDANDQRLLFWVHATLIDSAMHTYSRFVERLSESEREAFYRESKITARLFGIDESDMPATVADFDDYMTAMISGAELCIGRDGRRVAASITDPPLPPGLRQLAGGGRIFTDGLLPAEVRARFGIEWNPRRQRNLERLQSLSRHTLPLLPARLRYFPQAISAQRRAATTRLDPQAEMCDEHSP